MTVSARAAPIRLTLSDFGHSRYFVPAEPGVTLDDVTGSDFWAHVATQLRVHDVVEVVALDGTFEADLRLVAKGINLKWRVIREWRAGAAGKAEPIEPEASAARFEVKHVGKGVYSVVDQVTGSAVSQGHDKKGAEEVRAKLETERKAA